MSRKRAARKKSAVHGNPIRYSFRVTSLRVMDVAVYFDIEIIPEFPCERKYNAVYKRIA